MIHSIVRATASILPDRVVGNQEIGELLIAGSGDRATEAERRKVRQRALEIENKTGLLERRFFDAAQSPVDVAYALLTDLLRRSDVPWSELDGIVVSSSSVHGFPGVSQQVVAHARRDHRDLADPLVLDLGSNACTSFMYGVGVASSLLESMGLRTIACLAIEFSSRCLDYDVRAFGTSTLFGDAASGLLLTREDPGCARIESLHLGSRIDGDMISYIRGSGLVASDLASQVLLNSRWFMKGPPVALGAIEILAAEIARYQHAGVKIDWLIPHQANLTRILYPACDAAGIDRKRLCSSFDRTGNTSSASIPLLLDELLATGRARSGDNIVLIGFGASFSIGSAHVRVL